MNPKIYLKKNEEKRLKAGHLWVFSNEVAKTDDGISNGDLVDIYEARGEFIGSGFYNKNSLISARVLSRSQIDDLSGLFKRKLSDAYTLRKELYPSRDSFRMVFSESDFLPGLIIDKYNNTFVLQIYSYGMQKNIGIIIDILKTDFGAENIFSKNEEYFRKLEGLPGEDEIYLGEIKEEIINDGAVNFKINFVKGHKTGFYFDQSDNRFFIEKITAGKSVLDGFCNSGGFGLHAARSGASSVTFADSSSSEIESAKENFKLNGFECESEFIEDNIFNFLERCHSSGKKYDVVMIDPPAFAKSKKNLPVAKKGYEKLNRLALSCIKDGGFLVTSSCSHHLPENEFLNIISKAAAKTAKNVQLVHFNRASLDHPALPGMEETSYLKFGVFSIKSP